MRGDPQGLLSSTPALGSSIPGRGPRGSLERPQEKPRGGTAPRSRRLPSYDRTLDLDPNSDRDPSSAGTCRVVVDGPQPRRQLKLDAVEQAVVRGAKPRRCGRHHRTGERSAAGDSSCRRDLPPFCRRLQEGAQLPTLARGGEASGPRRSLARGDNRERGSPGRLSPWVERGPTPLVERGDVTPWRPGFRPSLLRSAAASRHFPRQTWARRCFTVDLPKGNMARCPRASGGRGRAGRSARVLARAADAAGGAGAGMAAAARSPVVARRGGCAGPRAVSMVSAAGGGRRRAGA